MHDILGDHWRKGCVPVIVSTVAIVAITAISWNALFRQIGDHPAPISASWQGIPGGSGGNDENSMPVKTTWAAETAQPDPLIRNIQVNLKELGLYSGTVDGLDGPATHSAVIDYQKRHGLSQTGKSDNGLLSHIQFTGKISDAAKYTGSTSNSVQVKEMQMVQRGLAELGYQPGPIDGELGEQTRQAIREFQKDRSLPETGVPSQPLIKELRKISGLTSLNDG